MNRKTILTVAGICCLVLACAAPAAALDRRLAHRSLSPRASNLIIPQSRSFPVRPGAVVTKITDVAASVDIIDLVATTTMEIGIQNPSGTMQEAEMIVPVPDGAVLRGFTFQGGSDEPTAEILPREEARQIYNSIVAQLRDPALVEFAGYNLIRTCVFPVPPNGTQRVRLVYENLLPADGNRVDYFLPRSELLSVSIPWKITVRIRSKQNITTVYSPSHGVNASHPDKTEARIEITAAAATEPGPFLLSYLTGDNGVSASLMAYPDPKIGGGYFLLLAGVPPAKDGAAPVVKREVTVVIDRSGSMAGEKIKQARAAALQVVEGLLDGEAFNIIDYSGSVSTFAPAAVLKTQENIEAARHYLRRLQPSGGTNIHDALIEALRPDPREGMLPLMLFLTDGLATVGVRKEVAIREAALKANVHKRRIFTFGVGYDVNAPLLSHLAGKSRAVSTVVMPGEDVEIKVSQVYRRLSGPVLSEPKIETVDAKGKLTTRRVSDLMPAELPDVFDGDKLVLLGKYKDEQPLAFTLSGDYRGTRRTFRFNFNLKSATTRNSFVPRLWANRKVAFLIEEIRQAGAAAGAAFPSQTGTGMQDPKMKELVDEIVRLSTEFGILTEYTAFLAKEGTDLAAYEENFRKAGLNLESRAIGQRAGMGAVNQLRNDGFQRKQRVDNRRNTFYDADMNSVQTTTVQQMNDRALYQRGARWIDSRTVEAEKSIEPDETIAFGSDEYFALVQKFVDQNRQGVLAVSGEILLRVDNKNVLVTAAR
ncbi:MAG: VWA domain-containing protein [Planctomycetes bacterium]|nr:VWA domain-containing protein [Planctomycetota bacterium]